MNITRQNLKVSCTYWYRETSTSEEMIDVLVDRIWNALNGGDSDFVSVTANDLCMAFYKLGSRGYLEEGHTLYFLLVGRNNE